MYKKILSIAVLSLLLCSIYCNPTPMTVAEEDGVSSFDPTFGRDMVHLPPDETFLDPYLLYACYLRHSFPECLEHYLRKAELQHDAAYKPMLNDLDETSTKKLSGEKPNNQVLKKRNLNIDLKDLKRNSNDELMSIFNKMMANNMRLKSSIKTTRF